MRRVRQDTGELCPRLVSPSVAHSGLKGRRAGMGTEGEKISLWHSGDRAEMTWLPAGPLIGQCQWGVLGVHGGLVWPARDSTSQISSWTEEPLFVATVRGIPKAGPATEWLGTAPLSMRDSNSLPSFSSSAAGQVTGDTAELGLSSWPDKPRECVSKGLIELVPLGFQVEVPRHHKRWISEPPWLLRASQEFIKLFTLVTQWISLRVRRPNSKMNANEVKTEVLASTSLDQQQKALQSLPSIPEDQEEGSPEGSLNWNMIECYTW